ncbi:MAG TPA: substrate-binding domain-containing protein [Xanthobacteraceae bacterium]|nr:substrate-binding domain-containing protein [Xanthobacteraceae bacterium]
MAAEIKIFTSMGSLSGLTDLAAAYEKATNHKVAVAARIGPALPKALESNEPGDIVANFTYAFDALIQQGKVVSGSVVEVARAGVGVAIRKGTPKPDISTVDAYKQTMLKAKSIGYSKTGSGVIAERGLQRLGIFDQVKDKVRYLEGTPVAVFVANGEVELGMQQSNAIVPVEGADYAGPLPGDLQEYLYFAVGVLTVSKQPEAAREFIAFMASPEAAAHLRKSAMEPPKG